MDLRTFETVLDSTGQILAGVTPDQLGQPTPCAQWDVRRLVNHIVGSTFWFAMSVDAGSSPTNDTSEDTDYAGADAVAAFKDGSAQALAAFGAPGALEKMVTLPFGAMPGAAFLALATNDQFVHGWDLAKATGQSTDFDPEIATALLGFAHMAIQDAVRGPEGSGMPFGHAVECADDATPTAKLVSFLGRTP